MKVFSFFGIFSSHSIATYVVFMQEKSFRLIFINYILHVH